jgi:ribonuclease BN (tRNA processing enzyme)
MKLKLLGVRGSRPTHKRALLGYGGNSTSFEFLVDKDFHLFVDGGSGLAHRGFELGETGAKKKFHFLMTHTHWDHILGIPMFQPIYKPENHFTFYASNTTRSTFNKLFFDLHRADNLPVPISEIKAKVDFKTVLPSEDFYIDDIKVSTFQLNHQGITLGYKIMRGESSACIITDNAPIENGNHMGESMAEKARVNPKKFEREFNKGLIDFLSGAHTVVFDTHFTEDSLKPDWGHSTPPRALEFCRKAGVKRLILFHHAPEDTDQDVVDKVHSVLTDSCRYGVEVFAAKEGDVWEICA